MSVSEEQRKNSMKFTAIYTSIVIGIIMMYICGYVGSIMGDYNYDLTSSFNTMINQLKESQFLFSLNASAFIGIFIGILIGGFSCFMLISDNQRNYAYKSDEVAGTGGFMSEKELKKYKKKYESEDPKPITENLPVSFEVGKDEKKYSQNMIMSDNFTRPVLASRLIGNNSIVVVGGAGTGKSRFLIKPNVLQMNASYVITDPSGEMIHSLGTVLKNHGYKIKIFNIADMGHSNCYNPLKYIRDEAGVNMVIECFIKNTTKQGEKGDQFFTNAEKLLYSACVFYLIDFCQDDSKKNFAGIVNMVNSSQVDEQNPNAKSPLDLLFDKCPKDSLAWKYYKAFKQAAGKTLKSIIISCVTRLQPFFTPQVKNLTKTDDLEIEKIGHEKTALFIITPQADRTYAFLASMLYSQLFETLYFIGEQQNAKIGKAALPIPVRCMMDEFANIGEVPEFPSRLATMRKYNISAMVVLQDIAQIESMYKDDWKTLVGNCSTKIFLGSSEPNTLKYFSDQLGKKTIRSKSRGMSKGGKGGSSQNFQPTGREPMTDEELGRLPSDECIVYTMNMRSVHDKKYRYERHPYFNQTADYDDKYAFKYKEMSAYDNTKSDYIESMIKAQSEAKRYNDIKTKELDKSSVKGNMVEEIDKVEIANKNVEKRTYMQYFQECQLKASLHYSDKVCMFDFNEVSTKYIPRLLRQTAITLKKSPMLIFTEIEVNNVNKVVGFGIDTENIGLEEAMSNVYAEGINRRKDLIMAVVNKTNLDNYKQAVMSKM